MVCEHAYYTPNSINSSSRSTSTFLSQDKTDHYILINYANTAVYFVFHVKGGNIK